MLGSVGRGQRTTCGNQFCPTIFVIGIELRSLGLCHVPLLAESFLQPLSPNRLERERIKFEVDSPVPCRKFTVVES